MAMPVGTSPTAMQKVVHPEGEIGSAKAAQEAGVVFTLSCLATTSLEEVAAATPSSPKWFQLYIYVDRCLTWEDIKWLVKETRLPVLAKGILRVDDAIRAVECGCQGIIVSNHGGRQLDSVPPTIEVLPRIAAAVGDKVCVIVDGGIRQGTDVFKAIALGAKMVLIGRPIIWGLTVGGQNGVADVLKIIQTEFDVAMAVSGCSKLSDITPDLISFDGPGSKL
uniref:FMN hydroxy acid dehydrogenase domain-containing protein n=1 Tax=Lutzomyia longipalpis TaxID=7200 RepID=A0A1B0GIZ8_LUTLO